MSLTAAGVGSGIDIESILSQLAEVEQQPVEALEEKRADLDIELSAFGSVKSALDTFQAAVDDLGTNSDFGAFVASSSDEEVFTATASSPDLAVNTDIEVLSLATHHALSSAAYESSDSSVALGTFTLSSADESFDIVVDSTNNTLTGMRDAINDAADNSKISASIINVDGGSRLVLNAVDSGTEGKIDIIRNADSILDDTEAGFEEITEAADASLIVHGFETTRSSNSISDVIEGVTIELTGSGTATLDASQDLTSLKEALDTFVTSYNSLSSTLTSLGDTDLQGDQLPRGIDQRMRSLFFDAVEVNEVDSSSALDMGFTFDRSGILSLDDGKYEEALTLGVGRYTDVFSKADTGVSSLFSDIIDEYTQAGGIIDTREEGVASRQRDIDDQIERLEYRIENTNERLRSQFTAMDLAVSSLQATSSFLTSRFSG